MTNKEKRSIIEGEKEYNFCDFIYMQYTEILQKSGLTEAQAMIFESLIKEKNIKAGKLAKLLPIKRGLVYKSLEDLVMLGLVEKEEKSGEVAQFRPKHPSLLRELVEKRTMAMKDVEQALQGVLPSMVSQYNLGFGAPGVLFYEGLEGIEKVLEDSLTAKEIIYSYVDVEAVEKSIGDINARYMKKRERLDIYKKLLVPDTPFIRGLYTKEKSLVTEVRAIPESAISFEVTMQIYDGKVSYLTLANDRKLGVIIEDPHIYQMHRYLFEMLYDKAEILAR